MTAAESGSGYKGRRAQVVDNGQTFLGAQEPSIVLSQEEAVQFLLRSAAEYEIVFCTNDGCEVCHAFVSTWDSIYSALTPRFKGIIEAKITLGQILRPRLPESPF